MADVQKQFETFHAKIRVDYDMAEDLRKSRDAVVDRIKKHIQDNHLPGFTVLHQGSYKMKTGVVPIPDLEYDIDVGLRFNMRSEDHDVVTVRRWVLDAVKEHTERVEDKGPCVRVSYKKGYHADLVTYAVWEKDGMEIYHLAHKTKGWRPADPPGLVRFVDDYREAHFKDTDDPATKTDQFRRCVRYLRRWNDLRIPHEADGKPTGLALVLLSIHRGLASSRFVDGRPDDRSALETLVRVIAATVGRIEARKPTPEFEEMFARLSDAEMTTLKVNFSMLRDALQIAGTTTDPVVACKQLQKVFGEEFPVPDPDDTARKTRAPAIITSSSSA